MANTSMNDATIKLEDLKSKFIPSIFPEKIIGKSISISNRITISGGLVHINPTSYSDTVDSILRTADAALYQAKDQGKNQIVTYRLL